ncbi:uncharacterized protein Tco025E_01690 [Trypanosoma conorhini]|uniref:Uncharacterized protein n=1 Tax=Trypanosoma conorhini TaxID=83891 RepID=A0A422Q7W8_9TRYP|nr:uncharacterized protein Tco025E_01690 [Trypanosoma conorhini]RNF26061.1 hypothetical protein Tco025E_01690 [Trypanosoma conorhini]
MSLRLSFHAHSVSPVSINFDALEAYVAGLSAEEALQYILDACVTCTTGSDKNEFDNPPESGSFDSRRCGVAEPQRNSEGDLSLHLSFSDLGGPAPAEVGMTSDAACATPGEEEGEKHTGEAAVSNHGNEQAADLLGRRFFADPASCTFHRELQRSLSDMVRSDNSFLRQEVLEQYVLFDMFRENYLATPYSFLSSYSVPMTLQERHRMVEVFYSVDELVLKTFFGDRMHKLELERGSEKLFFFRTRASHSQGIQKLMEAGVSEGSLRRQWENLKWVCNFLISAYRGRDGMLIPYNTPLLTALQQCFALRGPLGVHYGTFVFGFEHHLNGRFWHPLSYSECTTACQALSLWCDASQLMLREEFTVQCARIARLLDENRVVAEMHQLIFGEAMRSRWQVQFDEVQRAITSNTGVGTSGSPLGPTLVGAALPSPTTTVPHALLPRNTSTVRLDTEAQLGLSASSTAAAASLKSQRSSTPQFQTPTLPHINPAVPGSNNGGRPATAPSTAAASAAPIAAPNSSHTPQVGAVTGNTQASAAHRPHLSSNGAFTRLFLQEFPFIMKFLFRMATTIGNSGRLAEALDLFYVRVYLQLLNLGCRSHSKQFVDLSSLSQGALSAELDSFAELAELMEPCSTASSSSARRAPTTTAFLRGEEGSTGNPARAHLSETEEKLDVLANLPMNAVVNTSLVSHAVAFSSRRPPIQASPHQPQSTTHNLANHVAGTVDSRIYLCELCMLLSLLPNVFSGLTTLTEEDHAACDTEFANFVLTLKILVQIHLASDDN